MSNSVAKDISKTGRVKSNLLSSHKNILDPSYTQNDTQTYLKNEDDEIEGKLEDFDRKYMNALERKVRKQIDVITKIASHNKDLTDINAVRNLVYLNFQTLSVKGL